MNPSEVTVRSLEGADDMSACVALYETVFKLGPGDGSLNPRLMVGIARNGGSVLGAFDGEELVGFTLSFLARDHAFGDLYQYSQLATVATPWQGRGVGRRLKYAQRDATLKMGLRQIRWSFDPFSARNAHFNLDVLGAVAIELIRDLYGNHGHGFDAANSTPRLIASWVLDVAHERLPSDTTTTTSTAGDTGGELTLERRDDTSVLLRVPSRYLVRDSETVEHREAVLKSMSILFGEGLVATSCALVGPDVVYGFTPRASEVRER